MAKVNLATIKNWFKTGLKPTQAQFWSVFDSFRHKDDSIPVGSIENLPQYLEAKADKEAFDTHLTNANAHAIEFGKKVDKEEGKGLSPEEFTLLEKQKLAQLSYEQIEVIHLALDQKMNKDARRQDFSSNATLTGAIDGVNMVFTTYKPYAAGTAEVILNGVDQSIVVDYEESAENEVTFKKPPPVESKIIIRYQLKV